MTMPRVRNSRTRVRSGKAPALPSSSLTALHLVTVGARYSAAKLVEHAHAVLPKLDKYDFARFGFDAKWAAGIDALIAKIESAAQSRQAAADDALPTGDALHAAIAEAKEWRRDATTVLSVTPSLASNALGLGTGSSVAKLVTSMRKLLPHVAKPAAAAHGGGEGMRKRGQKAIDALERAQASHTKALGKVSPAVRTLSADKGALYEELRRFARVARRVAPADAHLFALQEHLATRMPSRGRKTKAPAPAPAQVG